jgi:hypothetical protein
MAVGILAIAWAGVLHGAAKPQDPNKPAPAQKPPAAAVKPAGTQAAQATLENPATFSPSMSFGRAIDILKHCTRPGLNIVVLWRDLEAKGIDQETRIGLDGVPGLRVRQYIELLLRSLSASTGKEMGYVIEDGVIFIATKEALPKPKMETRLYYIGDLVAPPSVGMTPMMMSSFGLGNSYGAGMPYSNSYNPTSGVNSTTGTPRSTGNTRRPAGR